MGDPLISIVVPTRDRPASLVRCLDALTRQTVAHDSEVVVVDDGSADAGAVLEAAARCPGARVIRRQGAGPAAARNAGARAAHGAILCFTDDDCEPHSDWAERLAEALAAGADAVAGATVPGTTDNALLAASELVAHAPAAVPPPSGSDLAFAPSNNLACHASVLAEIRFDGRYPTAAGEDRDWCARLTGAGHALRYEPAAVIVHRQELNLRSFWRQQLRYGRGALRFRMGGKRRPLEGPSFYLALLCKGFSAGPRVGLLVCAAQLATAIGFSSEWLSSRRASLSPQA